MDGSAAGISTGEYVSGGTVAVPNRRAAQSFRTPARQTILARGPRPAWLPLAPAQERMWHATRAGTSSDWNVARAVRISGHAVDLPALAAAIRDVVDRHEPLRTRYPATTSGPAQVVVPMVGAAIVPDIIMPTESELPCRIAEFAAIPFDLTTDLPFRARLCVLGPRDVVLILVVHHISMDGRSVAPLKRDLATAYLARQAGRAPEWSPLPVDYADYTLWKHAQLGDYSDEWSRATQQLRYWANALAGRPAVLEFDCARTHPATAPRDTTGATVPVVFDAAVHRALLRRAQQSRASLLMVLQAVFAVVVGALAGSTDITLATAVSGREHRLLDDLVGNFADDVLMRIRLDRAADVDELLEQVRRVALAAFAHPDTPNPRLQRCLLQDASCPLFQATLILQRGTAPEPACASPVAITELPTGATRAKHDLEIGLIERYDRLGAPAGVDGVFIYPTALFDPATAVEIVALFTATAGIMADGYRGPLDSLANASLRAIRDRPGRG
ncbi:condensation domain-containing protein [Nocardia sp. CA-128927]|uniref:condensation domain-containing protein n=1 Tax=Nocardia sp. CA-128927 TaxID=3239975 RepID=UPI003D98ED29